MSLKGLEFKFYPQFNLLKFKGALLEAEIAPHIELQKENHPNGIFDFEILYKVHFDHLKKEPN